MASHEDRYEAQHQAIVVIATLVEFDESWIAGQTDLINALKSIWQTDLYKVRFLFNSNLSIHLCFDINLIKFQLDKFFRAVNRMLHVICGI